MRFVRTAIIAGVASAALAGAAIAGGKQMLVAHPDGTVDHISVEQVRLIAVPATPADIFEAAFGPGSPFAEMERISAAMDAQADAMMRQASALQAPTPTADGKGIVMTNAAGQPVGVMHYSYVSSSTDASGCTQTVQYSSDGAAAADQPKVIRTSSGSCGSGQPAPQTNPVTPTAMPAAKKPAPKIIPVSAPKPAEIFTPSRT